MNFLIYGAGSLGLLFARYLSRNNNVELVVKPEKKKAIDNNSLLFISEDGKKESLKLNLYDTIKSIENEPDFIMLSVKSFDIDNALTDIVESFNDKYLITIQNGVYAEEAAINILGREFVLPAYVMIGARTINLYTIEQFLNNGMKIGYVSDNSMEIANRLNSVLNESGIDSVLSDNIMREKWHKMMFYCAGATLNSLTGTKNLEDKHLSWIVRNILDEIAQTAKNLNLDFDAAKLADEVYDFLMNFKPVKWSASVGEDLRKGKMTEIDYLNGYIVRVAEEFNISVPFNKMLTSFVKTIEQTCYFSNF